MNIYIYIYVYTHRYTRSFMNTYTYIDICKYTIHSCTSTATFSPLLRNIFVYLRSWVFAVLPGETIELPGEKNRQAVVCWRKRAKERGGGGGKESDTKRQTSWWLWVRELFKKEFLKILLFVCVYWGVISCSAFSVKAVLIKAYIRVQCFRKLNLDSSEYDIFNEISLR